MHRFQCFCLGLRWLFFLSLIITIEYQTLGLYLQFTDFTLTEEVMWECGPWGEAWSWMALNSLRSREKEGIESKKYWNIAAKSCFSELSLSQSQPPLSFNQATCRFRTEFVFGKCSINKNNEILIHVRNMVTDIFRWALVQLVLKICTLWLNLHGSFS